MDKQVFGQLITQLRKNQNLNQKELAEKLNVIPSTVCKWERGINAPDITCLSRLSQVLEISYDELLNPAETLERLQHSSTHGNLDESPLSSTGQSTVEGLTSKLSFPRYFWHFACAATAFSICFVCMYLYLHPRFTVIDTRYNYNGNFGVTYEMSVVGPKDINATALENYTKKIRAEWNANEYATDAEAIDITLYTDKETASNWGISNQYVVLIKDRPQEER